MALIECKDCKKEFSTDSQRCPNCGAFKPLDKLNLEFKGNKIVNPFDGKILNLNYSWLWCLLFGTFYFLYKGIWIHAFLSLILAICTASISWLIYPFFAKGIVKKHSLKNGWQPVK